MPAEVKSLSLYRRFAIALHSPRGMSAKGVLFSMPPKKQEFGGVLAQFVDSEGAHCSVRRRRRHSHNPAVPVSEGAAYN